MRRGDYASAFAFSDSQLQARDPATRNDPHLPYHMRWVWDGRDLTGRDVLVRCYHGLGDTLQFCRFLPELGARAAFVTVEVQPELLPLLACLPGVARWIAFDPARPLPPRDVDVEIMELSHALRLTPLDVPPPCLRVAPLRIAPGRPIGVCWRAGGWEPSRSVPATELLDAARRPATHFVSLQRGPAAHEADGACVNPGDTSTDIARTARLIAGAFRVVTVDTMVAHLAGTLGVPTWLLLKARADWRWTESGVASAWYPPMRLFRQDFEDDWAAPLAAMKAAPDG